MSQLFQELKRRNVFRVGIAYLVAAWLLVQVTDVLAPMLSLPDWAAGFIFLLLAVGFLPALIFAWAYELTPEGVRREREVDPSQSISSMTGRKLDFAIIAMLSLAIVYLVIENYVLEETSSPTPEMTFEKSIAVLPFRNRSDNDADAHFVDGIHDDILTQLAKLATLDKVISRTSTERYRDTELPIPQIGEELGVATILEGGVQRAGSRVRINVQLIDTSTDEHLWAESYDRELTVENLLAIQNEISREIVTALHGVLSDEESERLQQMPTTSLEAHAEYAFGRREAAKRTGEATLRAQAHFEKALELDPDYALAWVGLADVHAFRAYYLGMPMESTYEAREAAISKALDIDPLLGEAYATLGMIRRDQGHLDEAEEALLKAIELNPNYAPAYFWHSIVLRILGKYETSETQNRKAIDLDPLAPILREGLIGILTLLGRTDEAKDEVFEGVRRNPEFPGTYMVMSGLLSEEGRVAEALKWMQVAVKLNPTGRGLRMWECLGYLTLGYDEPAERCVDRVEADQPHAHPLIRAHLLESRGQWEEAALLVEGLLEQGLDPAWNGNAVQVLYFAGKRHSARALLEETDPEPFGEEEWAPDNLQNLVPGVMAATLMYADGEVERADYLFDQALQAMNSMSRVGPDGFQTLDAAIFIARGDRHRAIAIVRDSVERGYLVAAWRFASPVWDELREEPEWLSLIAEVDAELARQREWYEAHKDDPLF